MIHKDIGSTSELIINANPNLLSAIKALRNGQIIILLDRQNEGDLIIAAEKITPESMNFFIRHGSGIVCLPMERDRLLKLGLYPIPDNTNSFQTAFTVSIEARQGVTTGVSAKDRTHTIKTAINDEAEPNDLARPGHVFPLAAVEGGVFKREGHTEGSVDLMKIAGLMPAAVLCELMNEDGSMAMGEQRNEFAKKFSLPIISVEEILYHRMLSENIYQFATNEITTKFGKILSHTFSFFNGLIIHLFTKTRKFESQHWYKVSMVTDDNLHNRYLRQVMGPENDDPLFSLCSKLALDHLDIVAFVAAMHNTHSKPIIYSALCRSLIDLGIEKIVPHLMPEILPVLPYFSLSAQ
jgi:3,4-dihydroxy-2-butanone 4-phosphate synthase